VTRSGAREVGRVKENGGPPMEEPDRV